MNIPFSKMEAIGNDFVLIQEDDAPEDSLSELAIRTCRRRVGVGSDGLLTVRMDATRLRYRMFNPDGTEDFCGNGLRCAARYASDAGWVGNGFVIIHRGIEVPTTVSGDRISTILEPASYDPARVPVRFRYEPQRAFDRKPIWSDGIDSIDGSALATGSAHVVIMSAVEDEVFFRVSRQLECDPQFPERTSVIWAQEVEPMTLKIRIWERGVGETLGCGTGSAAAAVEYLRIRNAGGTVIVRNPGGDLEVSASAFDGPIAICGGARVVYQGEFPLS